MSDSAVAVVERLRIHPELASRAIAGGAADGLPLDAMTDALVNGMYLSGHPDEALACIEALVDRQDQKLSARSRIRAYGTVCDVLEGYGLHAPALSIRQRASALAIGSNESELIVYTASGVAGALTQLGRYREAEVEWRRAIDDADRFGASETVLVLQIDLASTLRDAGKLREAISVLDRALPKLGENGDPIDRSRGHATRSQAWRDLGDTTQAERDARIAVGIAEREDLDSRWLSVALTALGNALIRRAPQEAIPVFNRTAGIARERHDYGALTAALHNLGVCTLVETGPEAARPIFAEALRLATDFEDPIARTVLMGRLADTYEHTDLEQTLRWREREWQLAAKLGQPLIEANCLIELGDLRFRGLTETPGQTSQEREELFDEGLGYATSAVDVASKLALGGELDGSFLNRLRRLANRVVLAFTDVETTKERLATTWALADATRSLPERLAFERSLVLEPTARKHPVVAEALADVAAARQLAMAAAKDAIAALHGREQQGGTTPRPKVEDAVRQAEERLAHALFGAESHPVPPALHDSTRFLEDLGTLTESNRTAVVSYTMTGPAVIAFVAVSDGYAWVQIDIGHRVLHLMCRLLHWSIGSAERRVAAQLLYNALLQGISPWIGDRDVLVIPDGQLADLPWGALDPTPRETEFEAEVWPVLDDLLTERESLLSEASKSTSGLGLASIRSRLNELDAELIDKSADLASSGVRAVFDDRSISVCSSVRTAALLLRRAKAGSAASGLVAVADPALAFDDPAAAETFAAATVSRTREAEGLRALGALPHTRVEVANAAALLGADIDAGAPARTYEHGRFAVLIDHDATPERLRQALTQHSDSPVPYAAAHFGAHGLIFDPGTKHEGEHGDPSGLEHILPPQIAIVLAEGTCLTAHDLATLRLHTFVTTVLCCHSRVGSSYRPDFFVASLGTNFHLAGSTHVVACTGAVPDLSTAHLSNAFYRGLAKGSGPAEALAAAQRVVRDAFADSPSAWAPFVVSGPGAQVGLQRGNAPVANRAPTPSHRRFRFRYRTTS